MDANVRVGRPLVIWLLVTLGAAGCWAGAGGCARSLTGSSVWHGTFEGLLVAIASAALLVSACWLWLVTTLTVGELLRGTETSRRGLTHRLVLTACGVAMVAGVASPAVAGSDPSDQGLAGLPLPDRAVAGASARPDAATEPAAAPAPERPDPRAERDDRATVTVRSGDSLWSIAVRDLGPEAGTRAIDARWRELYAANRGAIGTDPDLITPGQQISLHRPADLDREPGR